MKEKVKIEMSKCIKRKQNQIKEQKLDKALSLNQSKMSIIDLRKFNKNDINILESSEDDSLEIESDIDLNQDEESMPSKYEEDYMFLNLIINEYISLPQLDY